MVTPGPRYSNREIDALLQRAMEEIHQLQNRPFEKDVRESLSRVETEIGQIKVYIEQRVQQERDRNDKSYAPMIAWTVLWGILGLFGVAIVMQVVKLIGL